MKLVDTDEIIRETDKVRYLRHIYIHQLMDRLPNVEAIPVEWIEEYCAENWVEYSSPYYTIRRMLEDWRIENGLLCD